MKTQKKSSTGKRRGRPPKSLTKVTRVLLPQTEGQFDDLIRFLVRTYNLPDEEHAAVVVANRIRHSAVDQAYVTMDSLAQAVQRNIAYQVAESKGSKISHKLQVENLKALLKTEPNNQQAVDALEAAKNEGSTLAAEALEEIFPNGRIVTHENVVPLTMTGTDDCEPNHAS